MQPAFIGGFGRSGTTLLADIIGFHDDISPIYETDFVLSLMRIMSASRSTFERERRVRALMEEWTTDLPRRPSSKRTYERYAHGPHHLQFDRAFALEATERALRHIDQPVKAIRTLMFELFAEHCRKAGKPRWVNKTPGYLQFLGPLHTVVPELLFVHMVRDGRDVAASVITRPWGAASVEEVAKQWASAMDVAHTFQTEHPEQFVQIRYETLLEDPRAALTPVLEALGASLPDDLVARYTARMGAFDTTRIGAYEETFTARDHARFLAVAGDAMERCGYSVEHALA